MSEESEWTKEIGVTTQFLQAVLVKQNIKLIGTIDIKEYAIRTKYGECICTVNVVLCPC